MGVSLVFPQVANEHKICVINIIVSYVAGEQLITPMKAQSCIACVTSLPSSTVDCSTGEDNIIMFCVCYQYINNDSGLLFIMCGYYSTVVVWHNYHGT